MGDMLYYPIIEPYLGSIPIPTLGEVTMKIAYHTTLYFEVPEEVTPDEYITWLSHTPTRAEMVNFATAVADGRWEVMGDNDDVDDIYRDVVVGDEVYWNDPYGYISGKYQVMAINTDGGMVLSPDDIIIIGNGLEDIHVFAKRID